MPLMQTARAGLLGALVLLAACQSAPQWASHDKTLESAFPGEHWAKVASPEDLGWSSAGLAEARSFSKQIGSTAVMVVQHGVVVEAWGGVATKSNLHSGRKSLLSGLIGLGVDRGEIDLASTLAELGIDDNPPALTEVEKTATVADLIKARSGVYHPALYETRAMTASKPPRGSHAPGSFWHYNNWDFNALGTIYEQQTGNRIFEAFARDFARPLQMEDYAVSDGEYVTGSKSIHPAYPFRMTARDFARFALLYLREGRWKDTRILSPDWVRESTASHSQRSPHSGYGYMWWTGEGSGLFPNVQIEGHSYYAAGWGGQYAIVIPSRDLVVIHRVNTDRAKRHPSRAQVGRLLWLILAAAGESGHGPDPSVETARAGALSGDDLHRLIAGSRWAGRDDDDGTPWRIDFATTGTMNGVYGHDGEHKDSGTWRIEGDRYCRRWSQWSGGTERCYDLMADGTEARAFDETGTLAFRMTRVAP